MTPLVSVVLPARTAGRTIDAAIESIAQQTFGDFELLAIDDGSTDDTAARIEAWARRDRRVVTWSTGGVGLVAALNQGLLRARGALIARMDADDVSEPRRFEASVERLEADASLSGVGTGVRITRADQPPSPSLVSYAQWLSSLTTPERLFADRLVESPLCHPSVMLRATALREAGPYVDDAVPEDWELWLRLLERGHRLVCLPDVLHRWADHDDRMTRTDARYGRKRHQLLRARVLAARLGAQPLTIWGAGETGVSLCRELQRLGSNVERFIDVNPKKIGQRIHGARVVWPDDLGPPGDGHVLSAVGARGARAEIRAYLDSRGFEEGVHFTCAA